MEATMLSWEEMTPPQRLAHNVLCLQARIEAVKDNITNEYINIKAESDRLIIKVIDTFLNFEQLKYVTLKLQRLCQNFFPLTYVEEEGKTCHLETTYYELGMR